MNPWTATKIAFANYANFQGRASREEYWRFYVLIIIVNFALNIIAQLSGQIVITEAALVVRVIFGLVVFVPILSAGVRRLHDSGRSGWRFLWGLTIIGAFFVLYWLAQPSQSGPNKYGPGEQIDTEIFA